MANERLTCERGHWIHGANLIQVAGRPRCRVCKRATQALTRARKAGFPAELLNVTHEARMAWAVALVLSRDTFDSPEVSAAALTAPEKGQ